MKILLDWTHAGGHYYVRPYLGPDRDHLAVAGKLCLRPDEAVALRLVIRTGIDPRTGIDGIFERGDIPPDELP